MVSAHLINLPFSAMWNFLGTQYFFNSKFESITKFRQAHFDSEANFLDSEFQAGGDFSECRFEDYANFSSTQFDGRAFFQSAKFQDKFIINEASFKQEAVFDFVTFDGVVLAKRANFTDKLRCTDGFHDDVSFEGSDFRGLAKFGDFEGVAVFRNCTFNIVVFYGEFQDDADFIQTDFDDEARFRGEFCEGVSFRKANFNTGPDFEDIDISNGIFVDANLQEANISDTSAKYANFRSARLENADMDGTNFSQANFEQAKLSGASLFDANLSGALLYSAHVRDVSVSTNTTFDKNGRYRCIYDPKSKYEYNFDDNQEVYAFATIEKDKNAEEVFDYAEEVLDSLDLDTPSSQDEDSFSTQNDDSISSDTEYENTSSREEGEVSDIRKGINTYYILEQLTRNNALLDEQAKFFVRRQDMRRTQLREDGRQVEYWFAEAQNAVFRHGESFSRVVAWSVGTIIAFAFLYPIGGWLKKESPTGELQQIYTYDAIVDSPILLLESFNHSALLFLTGTGPLKPVGFIGEVLTTSETLIAPILLLLLVFVLGRRAAR
uniref:Pentapeptide repeat-containing protein n=1 Tax=uncultured haloarchaeon TaxID=160804 RepID=A5YS33_9EURY|nr:hypothetical protein [uncultured haloarchaeon]